MAKAHVRSLGFCLEWEVHPAALVPPLAALSLPLSDPFLTQTSDFPHLRLESPSEPGLSH